MLIAALLSVLWYSGHAVLSLSGTCTMGSTDPFVAGAILGMPAVAIGLPVLLRMRARGYVSLVVLGLTEVLALLVLCLWASRAISVGVQGHHLCGPEFDGYLDGTAKWERLIPFAHVAIASAFLVAGFRSLRRTQGAAQPAVAADGASPRR